MSNRDPRHNQRRPPPSQQPLSSQQSGWSTSPYLRSLWYAIVDVTGLDYWMSLPNFQRFSVSHHLKRTFQLTGALAMGAFTTYSIGNWLQYRTYGVAQPWNYFGSYLHTIAITTIALLSGVYFAYGYGGKMFARAEDYHKYLSNKYVGSSYDL